MPEQVDHPSHYQGASVRFRYALLLLGVPPEFFPLECIVAIERLNLDFHRGNAVKYLWRCGEKGDVITDLLKARWYLMRFRVLYENHKLFSRQWFASLRHRLALIRVREAIEEIDDRIEFLKKLSGEHG